LGRTRIQQDARSCYPVFPGVPLSALNPRLQTQRAFGVAILDYE
jgi:hypothetical protein